MILKERKKREKSSKVGKIMIYSLVPIARLCLISDEDANYRVFSIVSYFLVLVIIGVPIWWFTTRVYRANLPLAEIDALKSDVSSIEKDYGIPLSLDYDILISLVHPDPGNLQIDLNGKSIDERLQPFLNKLSPVAKFIVKSQWLFATDLGVVPTKISEEYILEENKLSQVITPLESKLWSNISPRPVINLVIYFSPCSTLLYIVDKDKNKINSNAFLSPRWGGIYILNPDENSCNLKQFKPDLPSIINVFSSQIMQLLKVNNLSNSEGILQFKIRKTNELLLSTHRTLKSLAQLLSEISSIVISDDVGERIHDAVINAQFAEIDLEKGRIDDALEKSKIAFAKAEAAFGDPSLLALLYFPEDQK